MNDELNRRSERAPGEIVESFDPTAHSREVVLSYTQPRPLPHRRAARPTMPWRPDWAETSRRRRKKGLIVFCVLMAVLAVLTGAWIALSGLDAETESSPPPWQEEAEEGAEISIPTYVPDAALRFTLEEGHGAALTTQEVYAQANPAVVTVLSYLSDKMSVGTGVVFREDGYILTNYHVLEGGSSCGILFYGGEQPVTARYVAGDADTDIAVLKIQVSRQDGYGLPTAAFGDSDALTVGDPVFAIGNPLGVDLRGTLTDGIVSAINRDVRVDGRAMTLIQTNAALNFGNSGGPLINQFGQVVGINTVKMASSYVNSNVEGLGFAIPSASVQRIVNDLLTYGEVTPEPLLGVTVSETGTPLPGGRMGIEVLSVTAGGAAAAAGLQTGDILLTAGGQEIHASRELLHLRRALHAGDTLEITVLRDGKELALRLHLS